MANMRRSYDDQDVDRAHAKTNSFAAADTFPGSANRWPLVGIPTVGDRGSTGRGSLWGDLQSRICDLGSEIWDLGSGIWNLGCAIWDLRSEI